jgi:hypothetical protein
VTVPGFPLIAAGPVQFEPVGRHVALDRVSRVPFPQGQHQVVVNQSARVLPAEASHRRILGFAGAVVKPAREGWRIRTRVHYNEPRDLASGVGERIGEAEREGIKNWPEAVSGLGRFASLPQP